MGATLVTMFEQYEALQRQYEFRRAGWSVAGVSPDAVS